MSSVMVRKGLKIAAGMFVAAVVLGGVLYQFFGLRMVMDGGGIPRPQFVESSAEQAARVERHRAAQRTQNAVPASPPSAAESASTNASPAISPGAIPTGVSRPNSDRAEEGAPPLSVAAAPYWTDFRGPKRDGEYREGPLRLDWPTGGLTPIWKQPSGAGYAS